MAREHAYGYIEGFETLEPLSAAAFNPSRPFDPLTPYEAADLFGPDEDRTAVDRLAVIVARQGATIERLEAELAETRRQVEGNRRAIHRQYLLIVNDVSHALAVIRGRIAGQESRLAWLGEVVARFATFGTGRRW